MNDPYNPAALTPTRRACLSELEEQLDLAKQKAAALTTRAELAEAQLDGFQYALHGCRQDLAAQKITLTDLRQSAQIVIKDALEENTRVLTEGAGVLIENARLRQELEKAKDRIREQQAEFAELRERGSRVYSKFILAAAQSQRFAIRLGLWSEEPTDTATPCLFCHAKGKSECIGLNCVYTPDE